MRDQRGYYTNRAHSSSAVTTRNSDCATSWRPNFHVEPVTDRVKG